MVDQTAGAFRPQPLPEFIFCTQCGKQNLKAASHCVRCGRPLLASVQALGSAQAVPPPVIQVNDGTGSMIPTGNPKALVAYYLGIFALCPCFGILLGPAALILGIMGRKAFGANPAIRGGTHALVGIILGILGIVINILLIILVSAT